MKRERKEVDAVKARTYHNSQGETFQTLCENLKGNFDKQVQNRPFMQHLLSSLTEWESFEKQKEKDVTRNGI